MPRVDMRRLGRVLCFASCMFETVGDFHEIKLRWKLSKVSKGDVFDTTFDSGRQRVETESLLESRWKRKSRDYTPLLILEHPNNSLYTFQ
jgi:hypothetical protein